MNKMKSILEVMIKKMVDQIVAAGFTDPTHEDIKYKEGNKVVKFRLYREDQWQDYLKGQSDAKLLATKLGFGDKPDFVITVKEVVYYVRVLEG